MKNHYSFLSLQLKNPKAEKAYQLSQNLHVIDNMKVLLVLSGLKLIADLKEP